MNVLCLKCHKEQEARITREKPHRVVCSHCGSEIEGLNSFIMRSLVDQKKFVNEEKSGFSFHCDICKGVYKGVVQKDSKQPWVKCTNCGEKMPNVSDFMIRQMGGIIFTNETK